jgi:hypothetical protein
MRRAVSGRREKSSTPQRPRARTSTSGRRPATCAGTSVPGGREQPGREHLGAREHQRPLPHQRPHPLGELLGGALPGHGVQGQGARLPRRLGEQREHLRLLGEVHGVLGGGVEHPVIGRDVHARAAGKTAQERPHERVDLGERGAPGLGVDAVDVAGVVDVVDVEMDQGVGTAAVQGGADRLDPVPAAVAEELPAAIGDALRWEPACLAGATCTARRGWRSSRVGAGIQARGSMPGAPVSWFTALPRSGSRAR